MVEEREIRVCDRQTYPQYLDGIGSLSAMQRFALGGLPVDKAARCHSATDFGPSWDGGVGTPLCDLDCAAPFSISAPDTTGAIPKGALAGIPLLVCGLPGCGGEYLE
jgi:hypothetical protein